MDIGSAPLPITQKMNDEPSLHVAALIEKAADALQRVIDEGDQKPSPIAKQWADGAAAALRVLRTA